MGETAAITALIIYLALPVVAVIAMPILLFLANRQDRNRDPNGKSPWGDVLRRIEERNAKRAR